jgi:DNA-binding XRE family transcriptional regulator
MKINKADLKRARKRIGETQTAFSRRFGVDRSTYTAWENYGLPSKGAAPVLIQRVLAELALAFARAAE